MGVEDEEGQLATVASDKSQKEGIEEVPIVVPDLPQAGGVTAKPEIGKQWPRRNVGIVARRATRRVSDGKREAYERVICPAIYEESGVGQTDRRPGDASLIHASRVLHRGRGPNYCARGADMGGCSSSTPMTLAPPCSQKDKKSSRISTCGISG